MKSPPLAGVSCVCLGGWIAEAVKIWMDKPSDFAFIIGAMIVWFTLFAWREMK